METTTSGARQIALRVITAMFVACVLVDGTVYWIAGKAAAQVRHLSQANPTVAELDGWAQSVSAIRAAFWPYVVPASLLIFGLLGLFLWIALRRVFRRHMAAVAAQRAAHPTGVQPKGFKQVDQKAAIELNKRFFVHLFSVLQRQGRLMDFLAEDLSSYQDAQIGAAVRGIHEDCRKTVEKYLAPRPVLDQGEGEHITVNEGFDPQAFTLTGNVAGRPPFKAVIRHRGWRAAKLELPSLTEGPEAGLIAPAQVEVM